MDLFLLKMFKIEAKMGQNSKFFKKQAKHETKIDSKWVKIMLNEVEKKRKKQNKGSSKIQKALKSKINELTNRKRKKNK